ncbi:flagellar biosynthesis protein FliQ [Eubacteriales bacterium OttesenSCG-928-M02]|nr:flagellar biosynthesis protein FliQ [Eubacteriales bacterium OttesenSCG-928-M02]
MTTGNVLSVMQDALMTIITVSAPMLVVAMVVGVIVSIFQATTQINEQTLAFVPKIIAIFLTLLIFGGWILTMLMEFTYRMFDVIGTVG